MSASASASDSKAKMKSQTPSPIPASEHSDWLQSDSAPAPAPTAAPVSTTPPGVAPTLAKSETPTPAPTGAPAPASAKSETSGKTSGPVKTLTSAEISALLTATEKKTSPFDYAVATSVFKDDSAGSSKPTVSEFVSKPPAGHRLGESPFFYEPVSEDLPEPDTKALPDSSDSSDRKLVKLDPASPEAQMDALTQFFRNTERVKWMFISQMTRTYADGTEEKRLGAFISFSDNVDPELGAQLAERYTRLDSYAPYSATPTVITSDKKPLKLPAASSKLPVPENPLPAAILDKDGACVSQDGYLKPRSFAGVLMVPYTVISGQVWVLCFHSAKSKSYFLPTAALTSKEFEGETTRMYAITALGKLLDVRRSAGVCSRLEEVKTSESTKEFVYEYAEFKPYSSPEPLPRLHKLLRTADASAKSTSTEKYAGTAGGAQMFWVQVDTTSDASLKRISKSHRGAVAKIGEIVAVMSKSKK